MHVSWKEGILTYENLEFRYQRYVAKNRRLISCEIGVKLKHVSTVENHV